MNSFAAVLVAKSKAVVLAALLEAALAVVFRDHMIDPWPASSKRKLTETQARPLAGCQA